MRPLFGLGLFLCSCQLLPHKQMSCADNEFCEPQITAPFVLGQPDAKTNRFMTGFAEPVGVSLLPGGKLFVADGPANRFLVWNTFPTRSHQPADFVLGNANASLGPGTVTGEFVIAPRHLTLAGSRLIAMSSDDQGTLQTHLYDWPSVPAQHTPPASDLAFTVNALPLLAGPGSPIVVGSRLYLSDVAHHRLLTWATVPTSGSTPAPVAIGQTNLMLTMPNRGTNNPPTGTTLAGPLGMATVGTRLFVADSVNNRVLIWDNAPTDATMAANVVLGQPSVNVGAINQGNPAPSASSLRIPFSVAVSGTRVVVADSGNNRVLLWNGPVATNAPANVVLGQPDKTTAQPNMGGISGARLWAPISVATDGNRVVVGDWRNYRVLIWNSWPTADGAPADIILGQPSETANARLGYTPANDNFLIPAGMARSAKGFFVLDQGANRVMIYSTPPLRGDEVASAILGEVDPVSTSATTLFQPSSISAEGDALAVADTDNNRVAIWRNVTGQSQQPMDVALGQSDLSASTPNTGSANVGLNVPQGVFLRGGKLYVADSSNHRVLIWNSLPTQNQQADVVLGQADFKSTMKNRNGSMVATAETLNNPTAVLADDTSIYVCDTDAYRVLIWKTLTPTNGQPADVVLGQKDFSGTAKPAAISNSNFTLPVGLSVFRNRLYVVDQSAHRVVYFDLGQLANGMSAQGVYGQSDLISGLPNRGGLDIDRLYLPLGVLAIDSGLYIADANNSRIVALPPTL